MRTNRPFAARAASSSKCILSLMWASFAESRLHIYANAILERPSLSARCGMLQADERMVATYAGHSFTSKFAERDNPVWC